ncbi:MAG: hypothetical protein F6K31_40655 [Symploca sp. SIO2G7]|nr:hypothetical protein [Symploca sp. SIO2G7]
MHHKQINHIMGITATMIAAIAFFKVGDLSPLSLNTELPLQKAQVTTQQPRQEQSPSDLVAIFLVISPIFLLLFNKKEEKKPSEEETLAKALTAYLKTLKKDESKKDEAKS